MAERQELQQAADAAGLSLSAFVRLLTIAAIRRGMTVTAGKAA